MGEISFGVTAYRFIGKEKLNAIPNRKYYQVLHPRNLEGERMYVLDVNAETDWEEDRLSFTGFFSIVLTREEFERNFEVWED